MCFVKCGAFRALWRWRESGLRVPPGICPSVAGYHFQTVSEPSSVPFPSRGTELCVYCWCVAPGPSWVRESFHVGMSLCWAPGLSYHCAGSAGHQETWVPALAPPLTLGGLGSPASLCPLKGNVAASSEACSLTWTPSLSSSLPVACWHHLSSLFLGRRAAQRL